MARGHAARRAGGGARATRRVSWRARACRKDAGEQATLREAARRLSAVLQGVWPTSGPGLTEIEVALALETGMRRTGFSRPAFDTIVASGPNSALPHARAGDRRLANGDLVVLDFGGVYNGYCVDLTRTVSIGPPSPEAVRVYDAVRRAQAAAVARRRPGVAIAAVDAAAQGLADRGRLRGGVRARHRPRAWHRGARGAQGRARASRRARAGCILRGTSRRPRRSQPGMVVTIEPGAYLPGFGGVRIEDDVLVTAEGCEVLTTVGRDLLVC